MASAGVALGDAFDFRTGLTGCVARAGFALRFVLRFMARSWAQAKGFTAKMTGHSTIVHAFARSRLPHQHFGQKPHIY